MPPIEPTLLEDFVAGGILMGPFLLLLLVWLVVVIRFILRRDRTIKNLLSLFLFPIAFAILAIAQWALQWQIMHEEGQASGPIDPSLFYVTAIQISRTTLILVCAGVISLGVAAVMLALPLNERSIVHE